MTHKEHVAPFHIHPTIISALLSFCGGLAAWRKELRKFVFGRNPMEVLSGLAFSPPSTMWDQQYVGYIASRDGRAAGPSATSSTASRPPPSPVHPPNGNLIR